MRALGLLALAHAGALRGAPATSLVELTGMLGAVSPQGLRVGIQDACTVRQHSCEVTELRVRRRERV